MKLTASNCKYLYSFNEYGACTYAFNAYDISMDLTLLGQRIKERREKLGLDQAQFAKSLDVGQQTVSRWEKGGSRPKIDVLHRVVQLFDGDVNDWLSMTGYNLAKPVQPLLAHLPLDSLSEENFELFSRDFVKAVKPGWEVNRYGSRGHKQYGIDLLAKNKKAKLDYQCKRHATFGPKDVKDAVDATTAVADHHHILLSRVATTDARNEMDTYDDWTMLDLDDISGMIRDLPDDVALDLVDTYFPGWRKYFLGKDDPSPWLKSDEYFKPFLNKGRIYSHGWGFVGRPSEITKLSDFTGQLKFNVQILSGIGGVGKSRLLREWSMSEKSKVVFLQTGTELTAADFEALPDGEFVLVIDDAHERNDLARILSSAIRLRDTMKVLIGTRPYGLTQIKDAISKGGLGYDLENIITLTDLKVSDAVILSKEILKANNGDESYAQKIAEITKDCPLATVVGSRLVADNEIKPEILNNSEQFRTELLARFSNVVAGEVGGKDSEIVQELLKFIASVQPVDPTNDIFKDAASKLTNKRYDQLAPLLKALEDAGVLVRRNRLLRIAPDLLADYIRAVASYEEGNKQQTGYVDEVYKLVSDELATNLLVNLSQLDWRLSSDGFQKKILADIWVSIEAQFKQSKIFDRHSTLKSFSKIAYYQPKEVLSLIHIAIDNPTEEIEQGLKKYDFGGRTTYKYVLNEIPILLNYIAHNYEHLDESLDLLRQLAMKDDRPKNQNPDHPARVMQDLAAVQPGKPVVFNEHIVDHVLPWLDNESTTSFSPFDVLDVLLSPEGHHSETEGITLSLTPFIVNIKAVKNLRSKILKKAFEQLTDSDPVKSFRALETIEHGLQAPHGMGGMSVSEDTYKEWEPELTKTLEDLHNVITEHELDPYLLVQIRGNISSRARYEKGEVKKTANKLLIALPTKKVDKVARAMVDSWGWTFDKEGGTMRNEEKCTEYREALCKELLEEYEDNLIGLIVYLEKMEQQSIDKPLRTKEYGPFVSTFMRESEEFTDLLAKHLIGNIDSPLIGALGLVIMIKARTSYDDAVELATQGVELGDESIDLIVSRALGWNLQGVSVGDKEFELITRLATSKIIYVRHNLVRAVKRFGDNEKAKAVEVLLLINYTDSKEVAEEVLGEIGKHGHFKVGEFTKEQLAKICNDLVKLNSIEDYHIIGFLSELSAVQPEVVVDLLINRVRHYEEIKGKITDNYKPVPYVHRNGPHLRVAETKEYEAMLRKVRDWAAIDTGSWVRPHFGSDVFKMISSSFDESTLKIIDEWISSGESAKVDAVGMLLSEAPSNFVFTRSDYVVALLEIAGGLGSKTYDSVTSSLFGAAISEGKTGTPGQPFPQDIAQRDSAYDMVKRLPDGSHAHKFYKMLYNHALSNIERDTIEDLEIE